MPSVKRPESHYSNSKPLVAKLNNKKEQGQAVKSKQATILFSEKPQSQHKRPQELPKLGK